METMVGLNRRQAYKAARDMIKQGIFEKMAIVERESCHYGEYGVECDAVSIDELESLYKDGWKLLEII